MNREYQLADAHNLLCAIRRKRSIVYVLPTGGGKTWVSGLITQKIYAQKGRCLFLVHRRELLRQACKTLEEFGLGGKYGVISAGRTMSPWAPLQVASVQALARRTKATAFLDGVNVIFADEAHHVKAMTWEKVLKRFPKSRLIGMTATPQRYDGKPLGDHFEGIYQGPSISELTDLGWLAPVNIKFVNQNLKTSGVPIRYGDFSTKELGKGVTEKVVACAVFAYLRYAPGTQAIFFGVDVAHSRRVAEKMQESGISAAHADGYMTIHERDEIIERFRSGGIKVLCNVGLVDEGFDVPECETVLLGRETLSLSRYMQSCGRAMRPAEGKTAKIIDLAGCFWHHGYPDEARAWSLTGDKKVSRDSVERSARQTRNIVCPKCAQVYLRYARDRHCPQCGEPTPVKQTVRDIQMELIDGAQFRGIPPRQRKRKIAGQDRNKRMAEMIRRGNISYKDIEEVARITHSSKLWTRRMARSLGLE